METRKELKGKQWKHEKCNTNIPPNTIPSGPPTAQFGKKVKLIVDNVDLSTCRYYNNGNCDAAEGGSGWSPPCSHRCKWFVEQRLMLIEQKYNKLILEAEDAPICPHYKEKSCIQQERDRYKEALDNIEHILEIYYDDDWKATREIQNIINKINKPVYDIEFELIKE